MSKYVLDLARPGVRAYGPYLRKSDGRQMIALTFPNADGKFDKNSKNSSVSYPKWLVEQRLERVLDPKEENIDHIDKNPLDNSDSNIQILSRSEHSKLDARRVASIELVCIWCNLEFTDVNVRGRVWSKCKGKAGPFCSRTCSGKYGASVQNGAIKRKYEVDLKKIYYTNKDKI